VSGALTFETAKRAHDAGIRVVRSGSADPLQIDCAGVTESDSAGLAVLIDWLAVATRLNRKLTFVNIPPGIRAAAKISDVEFLFA
jgi:phospholipid transport system transporter-binding protein